MTAGTLDVVVVGAGIVGLATAHALVTTRPGLRVTVLEKEPRLAAHQTGRNSGVIHSGVYYRPGSLKAVMTARGRRRLLEFCAVHGVAHEVCGKVIVATSTRERVRLDDLASRALANGVRAELVGPGRLRELEPHVTGVAALHVPDAGIVDFRGVCDALAAELGEHGAEVRLGTPVTGLRETSAGFVVATAQGELHARRLITCAGLHADRVAALATGGPGEVRIVPFRGEYYELTPARRELVRNLVYPVPDPAFPFLGVHFTRMVDGGVHAGPNAVLALAREGYRWRDVDLRDTAEVLSYGGFWRLARRHAGTGVGEVHRSLRKRAFVRALQRLIPAVQPADLVRAPAGVRAQALHRDGRLVDDFAITQTSRAVHVVNAPSPAATASLEIGRVIAERALADLPVNR